MWGTRVALSACFLFSSICAAQEADTDVLLQKASELVYNDPSQCIKIVEHIMTLQEPEAKSRAAVLAARASLVKENYGSTLKWARLAQRESGESGVDSIQLAAKSLLAEVYDHLYLFELSKKYRSKSNSSGAKITNGTSLQIKAQEFENKANVDSARIYFERNLDDIDKSNKGSYWKAKGLLAYGNHLLAQKKYPQAIANLNQAIAAQQKIGNPFIEKSASEKLSLAWLALGDRKKFTAFKTRAAQAEKNHEKNITLATNLAFEYLQQDKAESISMAKKSERTARIALGFLIIILFLTWLILKWKHRMQANHLNDFINYLSYIKRPVPAAAVAKVTVKPLSIPKQTEESLLSKLNKFENGQKFLSKDISLASVATLFETNTKYLSEVINKYKKRNFNTYINELRVGYIVEKLKSDPQYRNYKVSYLAEECGFSSHSLFSAAFKTVTGLSPNVFINFIQEDSALPETIKA